MKGFCTDSFIQRPSTEAAFEKHPDFMAVRSTCESQRVRTCLDTIWEWRWVATCIFSLAKAGTCYFSYTGCHFHPLNSRAPYLCSSSALLKLVVTIFIFLLVTFIFSYSGSCHPHAFPLLYSTALLSPPGNLLYMSGTLIFRK